MKIIPQVIKDRMEDDDINTFLLFRIGPNSNNDTYLYTSLPYDYSYGGYVYSSENRVISIDPPRVSDSLDKSSFRIGFSDEDGYLRSSLDTWKMHGAPFVVLAGFINNTNEIIYESGVARLPNMPFNAKVVAYEGTVDTFTYGVTPNEEIILEIEGASPMGALDLKRTVLTSRSYLNQEYPGDTSYDQVTEGSRKLILFWGKE